jgi:hypothetical protein
LTKAFWRCRFLKQIIITPISTSRRMMLATVMPILTPMVMEDELLELLDEAGLDGLTIATSVLLKTVSFSPTTIVD